MRGEELFDYSGRSSIFLRPFTGSLGSVRFLRGMLCCEVGLWLFFLGDIRPSLGNVPSGCFAEPVPEIVERGEITGFNRDHPVVCCAPDMGVFSDDLYIFGQILLELFPTSGRLLLIRLG